MLTPHVSNVTGFADLVLFDISPLVNGREGLFLLKCVAVYNWESYQPAKHFIAGYLLAAALKYGSK